MNIMQIMKQAQNVQAKLKSTQEELAKMELVGESGGGAVKIVCDGLSIFIQNSQNFCKFRIKRFILFVCAGISRIIDN